MRKLLSIDSPRITDTDKPFIQETQRTYLKKRLQFWNWRLHRTMGNPVLVRRRKS